MRQYQGTLEIVMASSTFTRLEPSAATMARAIIIEGMHMMESSTRIMIASTRPPTSPHTAPRKPPSTTPMATAPKPTSSELREPWTIRAKRSRP